MHAIATCCVISAASCIAALVVAVTLRNNETSALAQNLVSALSAVGSMLMSLALAMYNTHFIAKQALADFAASKNALLDTISFADLQDAIVLQIATDTTQPTRPLDGLIRELRNRVKQARIAFILACGSIFSDSRFKNLSKADFESFFDERFLNGMSIRGVYVQADTTARGTTTETFAAKLCLQYLKRYYPAVSSSLAAEETAKRHPVTVTIPLGASASASASVTQLQRSP